MGRHGSTSDGPDVGAESMCPVFATTDIERAVDHYQKLGFRIQWDRVGTATNLYGYAFARRGTAGLHIVEIPTMDVEENARQAYLATPDPDALAEEWQRAGVGDTYSPRNGVTGYEGSHIDLDYNVLRFGIPAVKPGEE